MVGNSSTRATGHILFFEKTGTELCYQFRPQSCPQIEMIAQVALRDVCSDLLCKSIEITTSFPGPFPWLNEQFCVVIC